MMYYEFEVDNKVYKLRLNTRNLIALENKLGCNPIAIFGNGDKLPTVTEMVEVLHASLQQYNHGMTMDATYELFDKYLEDNAATDFVTVILEIYKASGLIRPEEEAEADGKN